MWIKVKDHIAEIVEKCFSEEYKEALEFTVNNETVTLAEQFKYHYGDACFYGTKEDLISAIRYRAQTRMDIILRLQDLKTNINKVTELGEYSKVNLGYKETLGTETTIGASAAKSKSTNKQTDQFKGYDLTTNVNISDDRTGTSQTNLVNKLDVIFPQPSISLSKESSSKFSLSENQIQETETQIPKVTLNNPQHKEGDNAIGYQNLTKELSTTEGANTINTSTSRGGETSGDLNSNNLNTNVKGSKSDEINRNVEFVTNDARVKLWKLQLPNLRTKFWNCLYTLFEFNNVL